MTVTLATLPQASAQEVFDHVARHLLTQLERSTVSNTDNAFGCKYRLKDGSATLMCAAGSLIADNEYDQDMEDQDWEMLVDHERVPDAHRDLIQELQETHDKWLVREWADRLRKVAERFDLSPAVVNEMTRTT